MGDIALSQAWFLYAVIAVGIVTFVVVYKIKR